MAEKLEITTLEDEARHERYKRLRNAPTDVMENAIKPGIAQFKNHIQAFIDAVSPGGEFEDFKDWTDRQDIQLLKRSAAIIDDLENALARLDRAGKPSR